MTTDWPTGEKLRKEILRNKERILLDLFLRNPTQRKLALAKYRSDDLPSGPFCTQHGWLIDRSCPCQTSSRPSATVKPRAVIHFALIKDGKVVVGGCASGSDQWANKAWYEAGKRDLRGFWTGPHFPATANLSPDNRPTVTCTTCRAMLRRVATRAEKIIEKDRKPSTGTMTAVYDANRNLVGVYSDRERAIRKAKSLKGRISQVPKFT